jgi:hypothetical protein
MNLPRALPIRTSQTSFLLTLCLIYIIFSANVCKDKKIAKSRRVVPAFETKLKMIADSEDGKNK